MSNTTNKKHPFDVLKEKGLFVPMIVAVCALILGLLIGIGVGGGDSSTSKAVAKPAPTVTVTASAAPAEAVISVPQECLEALDEADRGFSIAGDMLGKYSEGITQITNNQISDAYDTISDIKGMNEQLNNLSPNYNSDKTACRAAAQ